MDSKWNIIFGVLLLIISSVTLVVVIRSCQLSHQSNLPVISAVIKDYYNEEERLYTEKIIVNNGGGPITYIRGNAYEIMEVNFYETDIKTYIPLRGYFIEDEYSGNTQGLLLTIFRENNHSDFSSIYNDFRDAASEDGYEPSISRTHILSVRYRDYSGQFSGHWLWGEYFSVFPSGSFAMELIEAREILDSADEIEELAESAGLSLYIWSLDGRELWDWYKEEILQD